MGDDLVERHRIQRLRRDRLVLVLHHGLEPRRIGRGETAELERLRVHLDRDAVDLDRLLDRLRRQRQQALLIGIAHHHDVGGDGIAEQRFGGLGEIVEGRILAQLGFQHVVDLAALEIEIAVEDEVGGRNDVGVDDADGAAGFAERDGVLGGGHHLVGGHHEIGGAGDDARTGDVGGVFGKPDVAQHRAALLREAGHVEDHAGLALDMRGHAEQRADRQHAGAADAADRDVVGPLQRGQRGRLRQIADIAERSAGARRRGLPPSMVTKDGQKPFRQE